MDLKELGQKLREAREEAGYTQQRMADDLNISLRTLQYFEKGEKMWSLEKVIIAFKLVGYSFLLVRDVEEVEP